MHLKKNYLFNFINLLLLLPCIVATPSRANARTIAINESTGKIPIGRDIEYYEDREGRLGIADIAGGAMAGTWIKSESAAANFGFTKSTYWVRFTVTNGSGNDLACSLEQVYPLISNLRLYVPGGTEYTKTEIGHARPFNDRPVDYWSIVFPVTFKAGRTTTCYLAYRSESAMNIDLVLWSKSAFEKKIIAEAPILWMFYGILIVMFAYNLVIFLSIRDPSYFYCALYIGSFCLFMMSLTGLAYQYLWPDSVWWSNKAVPFFMGIIILSIIQFARYMGEIKKHNRTFDIALRTIMIVSLVISGLTLLIDNYRISIIAETAFAGIAAAYGSYVLIIFVFRYRHRASRYYGLAFMLFLVGVMLYVLKTFGVLPDVFITNYGIQIGAVFNVIALSLGLTDRINAMKNNLLELNASLEDKVNARTRDLEKAMQELEVVNETLLDFNEKLEENQRLTEIDMKMAANVQTGMLPPAVPESDTLDVAFAFKPMSGVSGDFYDFYETGGRLSGVGIFDVSGHGVASGLITMIARSIFFRNMRDGAGEPLNRVLVKSNRELTNEIGNLDNYLTGIVLRFNGDTVEYVNAGHSDLLVKNGATGEVGIINIPEGDIKGLFMGIKNVDDPYQSLSFRLNKNDILLLHTDCLFEGRNAQQEHYGIGRLTQSLKTAPSAGAREVLDHLLHDFYHFIGLAELTDDLTVIVIKKTV